MALAVDTLLYFSRFTLIHVCSHWKTLLVQDLEIWFQCIRRARIGVVYMSRMPPRCIFVDLLLLRKRRIQCRQSRSRCLTIQVRQTKMYPILTQTSALEVEYKSLPYECMPYKSQDFGVSRLLSAHQRLSAALWVDEERAGGVTPRLHLSAMSTVYNRQCYPPCE